MLPLELRDEDVSQRQSEEGDGKENRRAEKQFFHPAFGSVNITLSTEGGAQTGSPSLQENGRDKDN